MGLLQQERWRKVMSTASAWLIGFGKKRLAAIGERELLHIVYQPRLYRVPQAYAYCDRVMVWEGQFLPVWDLVTWFKWKKIAHGSNLVAVVGYTAMDTGLMHRGAISIAAPPKRISVHDEDACALPDDSSRWEAISTSCFFHEATRVPTLDLTRMFQGPITALAEHHTEASISTRII
jgi:chemotaxis signal transduction protein